MAELQEPNLKKQKMDDTQQGVERCKFYVKRKRRFCKMMVKTGREYCGEHETIVVKRDSNGEAKPDEVTGEDRIPCPLDGNHTLYAKNLKKHLKICNARPKEQPAYVSPGINHGEPECEVFKEFKLSDVTEDILLKEIIPKVEELYEKYVEGTIEDMFLSHDSMKETIADESYGPSTLKHLVQSSAILGIADKYEFLQPQTCFVEYGAGKGQLSFYLSKIVQAIPNTKVLLVDRASLRHKKENKIEVRDQIQRVRVDIANLDLKKLDVLHGSKRLVGLSKHLCGAATDLTLRCIVNGMTNNDDDIPNTDGFIIALCCHHQITYRDFVGKEFLELNGIDRYKFSLLTKMVGWYICGTGVSRERRKEIEDNPELIEEKKYTKISRDNRELIGFKCKRILDYARKIFMEKHGFECSLKYYVTKDITLERVCLIGKRVNKKILKE